MLLHFRARRASTDHPYHADLQYQRSDHTPVLTNCRTREQGSTTAAAPTASRAWESTPGAPQAVGSCRPLVPRQACRAAGQPRTARPAGWLLGRCPVRRGCGALHPRPLQDVAAGELVVQRVQSVVRDRPWPPGTAHAARHGPHRGPRAPRRQQGGTSHDGHSPALLASPRADEAAALPITGGCVVRPARSVLRPPPTPCWPAVPFPDSVIGRHAPTLARSRRASEGLPSSRHHLPNVPRPLRRGVLGGCTSRVFTASMAFALRDGARLPLLPHTRAHSRRGRLRFDATDRLVAPPSQGL